MKANPRLLAVLAHPDDESLGNGGMLAKYAAEGVETFLVTATRGERGWFGAEADYPGPTELGRMREAELRAAAEVLGIREVTMLDYVDGEMENADPEEVTSRIVREIRRVRPHVVVTFDPNGLYGHPDHIAVSRRTTDAVKRAAENVGPELGLPHTVDALYYMAWTQAAIELYQRAFGEIVMEVDGETRRPVAWPETAIDARIDTSEHWKTAWSAIACHRSQLPGYESLLTLPESYHRTLWRAQTYVRAGGRSGSEGQSSTLFDPAGVDDRGGGDADRGPGRSPRETTRVQPESPITVN